MRIFSFTLLSAGWLGWLLAIFTLFSHGLPGGDWLHANYLAPAPTMAMGVATHVAAAIFIGGISWILVRLGHDN